MKAQRMFIVVLIFALAAVYAPVNAQTDMADANKATFQRIIDEAWNGGNLDVVNEIVAPDFVAHTPNGDIETADGLRNLVIGNLRGAMSDLHMDIEVLIAQDDLVGSRVSMTGTFDGIFLTSQGPIQANGQPVLLTFNNIDRFNEAGQFIEEWTAYDSLAFLTELGAIPMEGSGMGDMTMTAAVQGEPAMNADTEANTAAIMHLVDEAFNKGNVAIIGETMSTDYMSYDPLGVPGGNARDFMDYVSGIRASVPDLMATADHFVAEGNWVMFHFSQAGTFSEPMMNADGSSIPATGQPLALSANILVQFDEAGQVIAEWDEYDNLGFLTQLGVISMDAQ